MGQIAAQDQSSRLTKHDQHYNADSVLLHDEVWKLGARLVLFEAAGVVDVLDDMPMLDKLLSSSTLASD